MKLNNLLQRRKMILKREKENGSFQPTNNRSRKLILFYRLHLLTVFNELSRSAIFKKNGECIFLNFVLAAFFQSPEKRG